MSKVAKPIFRLALVALEIKVVENFSAILVRDRKDRQAKKRCSAFRDALQERGLPFGVEPKRVHQVRAD